MTEEPKRASPQRTPRPPYRVLVVDDSAVVRQTLEAILSNDPELRVIGTAVDPFEAARLMRAEAPDVITLDVEMPRMDGVTFLRKLMEQHPIPVVMCSTLVGAETETLAEVLAAGAVDIVCKPRLGVRDFLEEEAQRLCDTVKAAAQARLERLRPGPATGARTAAPTKRPAGAMARTTQVIVGVGASTGGTEALRQFLEALPPDSPPVVIVQHMPEKFTAAFAARLDGLCAVSVAEARHGDRCLAGHVLIAPGNRHMRLTRSGATYTVTIDDGPLVSRHRPSVDVLFHSIASAAGRNAVGVIMTGMGADGAEGLKAMRDAGAMTFGQDEASCVVYGMPKEAVRVGAVVEQLPLAGLAPAVLDHVTARDGASAGP
ncbi:MAG: chemotaxis response regulator protein-glutamate methylesterase [Pseudomonadota bacterium]